MPMHDYNHFITRTGLKAFSNTNNLGLIELSKTAGIKLKEINTYHLGFAIGPRINAAGRLGDPLDALRLLTTQNTTNANLSAIKLNHLNITRQEITKKRLGEAEEYIEKNNLTENKIIIVVGNDWEEGVIGLIAGKVCEKYQRPTIALSVNKDKITGSCRSIDNVNITEILSMHSKFLTKYGGHEKAAGLSVIPNTLQDFIDSITEYCNLNLTLIASPEIKYDSELTESSNLNDISSLITLLYPFGERNPKIRLLLKDFICTSISSMGSEGKHSRLTLSKGNINIQLICFNINPEKFIIGKKYNFICEADNNTWNGNTTLQFTCIDYTNSK